MGSASEPPRKWRDGDPLGILAENKRLVHELVDAVDKRDRYREALAWVRDYTARKGGDFKVIHEHVQYELGPVPPREYPKRDPTPPPRIESRSPAQDLAVLSQAHARAEAERDRLAGLVRNLLTVIDTEQPSVRCLAKGCRSALNDIYGQPDKPP